MYGKLGLDVFFKTATETLHYLSTITLDSLCRKILLYVEQYSQRTDRWNVTQLFYSYHRELTKAGPSKYNFNEQLQQRILQRPITP